MPHFCIPFYANYTILAIQRGGMAPCSPPKYAPGSEIETFWTKTLNFFRVMDLNSLAKIESGGGAGRAGLSFLWAWGSMKSEPIFHSFVELKTNHN